MSGIFFLTPFVLLLCLSICCGLMCCKEMCHSLRDIKNSHPTEQEGKQKELRNLAEAHD